MSDVLIANMRKARRVPQVALQQYNTLRSNAQRALICVYEGHDDVTFFETAFRLCGKCIESVPLVVHGKDLVLGLRDLLGRNMTHGRDDVKFFVDHDFDGLKGRSPGPDIYCTPTYSIENFLVSEKILSELLKAEFRCNDQVGISDIGKLVQMFNERLGEFVSAMYDINLHIFYARSEGIKLSYIEDNIRDYLSVNVTRIAPIYTLADLERLIGLPQPVDAIRLEIARKKFDQLDPVLHWRGKFLFGMFKLYLSQLKDDRGRQKPAFFSAKAKMSFNPALDIIRAITSVISIPPCLLAFLAAYPERTA